MSMRIVSAAINTEQSPEIHEARLLLLLKHAYDRGQGSIDGIMKLAKLDFLIRYPKYLEDLLNKTRKRPVQVPMHNFEVDTVESKMIRFRYGPWDPRYRQWIALLCAKGLIETYIVGRTVHVRLTEAGVGVAQRVSEAEDYGDLDARCKLLCKSLGDKSGTWLKDAIYAAIPSLGSMAWGEEIEL